MENSTISKSSDSLKMALTEDNVKVERVPAMDDLLDFVSEPPFTMNPVDTTLFDDWIANDLQHFLSEAESLSSPETGFAPGELSPDFMENDSPLLGFDGVDDACDLMVDSPLFDPDSPSFAASPLDPSLNFFPEMSAVAVSLVSAPAITIPASPCSRKPSAAMNIPWTTESANMSVDATTKALTALIVATQAPPQATTEPQVVPAKPAAKVPRASKSKRGHSEVDPNIGADELALKRAKNTDAARRSRMRKLQKMESLEQRVAELEAENAKLQTKVAVLESEKKGLEENAKLQTKVAVLEYYRCNGTTS